MRKMVFALSVVLLSSTLAHSQTCNCTADFEWMKKTFKENDAGFQYALDKKGTGAFDELNKSIAVKVKKATNAGECRQALYEWLQFFRKGHININLTDSVQKLMTNNVKPPSPELVNKQEKVQITDAAFQNVLKNIQKPGFEGIWFSNPYTIGIIKTGETYSGFIIDAPGTAWQKNQLKLKIFPSENGFNGTVYMRDFSKQENVTADSLGVNYLRVGVLNMKRKEPVYEDSKEIKAYLAFLNNGSPHAEKISDSTVYLRIPDFDITQKKKIDSVLKANDKLITAAPNLIIDVRNNGGGADASYRNIMQYLYTNPVRVVGTQMYSTPLNNETMLRYSKDTADFNEEDRQWFKDAYNKLNNNLGRFISVSGEKVSVDTMDKVYPYPANVGIIINENNASTTEQFLLAAKQSRKVKLFGTTTFGALDISNMNYVVSPDGAFELAYCRSKSFRIPEFMIDGTGLQPDYYMDSTIPQYKWVSFVNDVLSNK